MLGVVLISLEEAAIGGHPQARLVLGDYEWNKGNYERAVKHYTIAANLGYDESTTKLMDGFFLGFVSEDDLIAASNGYGRAVEATKSPQREMAEEFYRVKRYEKQMKVHCLKKMEKQLLERVWSNINSNDIQLELQEGGEREQGKRSV